MPFPPPPEPLNAAGEPRRLGFELELAGIDTDALCSTVQTTFGGHIEGEGPFLRHVRGTELGDFTVEIDTALLKDRTYLGVLQRLGIETDEAAWRAPLEDLLARLAGTVVPHEVSSGPIALPQAHEMERLRAALQAAQARGTRSALRFAFGLHLNPEVPALTADSLTRHLRAFLLLRDALRVDGNIDLTRRLSPFIRDFPEDYVRRVVAPDYRPDLAGLARDYARDNATRNRSLDLLPVLAHAAADALPAAVREDPLLKPRPTFHYRLPNCAIDEPDWTLGEAWAGWLAVERLAADREALDSLAEAYLAHPRAALPGPDEDWAARTRLLLA